jgi:hypothetical protein
VTGDLPRGRVEAGAATDGQWDAANQWAYRRRRNRPQNARDAWAAFNAAEALDEDRQIVRGGNR